VFSSINAALSAAQPNDKVYLSGGAFQAPSALVIDKTLHFFGAGIGADSTAATGITTVGTQAGNIVLTTAASGSTFTGIIFSPAGILVYGTTALDDDP
jgi:Ca2+-binding RTX toxin-like protein